MPNAPTTPSNVDVILLFGEESLLFNESRQFSLKKTIRRKKILKIDLCFNKQG
jgi:hypothetical protein